MKNFGISGIWESPATTIPAVLTGIGGIVVALGWCDLETWTKVAAGIGAVAVTVVGALYKGKQ